MALKTVLITGCSANSLGDALAQAYHATRRYRVFATARNPSTMSHFSSLGIETLVLDVNSAESIAQCVKQVSAKTGGTLDLLVNNTGMQYTVPVLDIDLDKARYLFETNVWSYIAVTQRFMPLLLKAAGYDPTTQRIRPDAIKGRSSTPGVVIHTSLSSILSTPFHGVYNMSKAAAAAMTNTLRLELEPLGIRVIELKTGNVKSNIGGKMAENKLPPSSIYNVAQATVDRFLSGVDLAQANVDSNVWSKQVTRQIEDALQPKGWFSAPWNWLSGRVIWGGGNTNLVYYLSFLPPQFTDMILKDMGGVNIIKKALRSPKVA